MVRLDLPIAQQLVQTAHAAQECGLYLTSPNHSRDPDSVVLLQCKDEAALVAFYEQVTSAGIKARLIREPDIGNQATSWATEPISGPLRRVMAKMALWRPAAPATAQFPVEAA